MIEKERKSWAPILELLPGSSYPTLILSTRERERERVQRFSHMSWLSCSDEAHFYLKIAKLATAIECTSYASAGDARQL